MKSTIRIMTLAAFLTLPGPGVLAQKIGFSVSAGMASQRMDDLKYLQQYILSTYPVEGKITSSFPPFTNVSVNLVWQWYDHIYIGGGYSFSTTGGKSSYTDLTGSISTEINASSHRLGAFLSYYILGGERLSLSLYGRVDANLSSVEIGSGVNIVGRTSRIYNHYRSISPSITAGLEFMYNFSSFSLGLDAGYLVDLAGNLHNTETDEDLFDPSDRDRILTSDWTGWYAGIKARIWLKH